MPNPAALNMRQPADKADKVVSGGGGGEGIGACGSIPRGYKHVTYNYYDSFQSNKLNYVTHLS
jgi:hypothetical protein